MPCRNCLDKANFNIQDAGALAKGVEAKKLGNGDAFHVVTVASGELEIRFTVVTGRGFVFAYDEESDSQLEAMGCAVDGRPLNEDTT